jgi:outer membrane protein assembly factor BamB
MTRTTSRIAVASVAAAAVSLTAGLLAPAATAARGAAPNPADWPTYQRDAAHTGFVDHGPDPATLQRAWRTAPLDGDIYGEPIVVGRTVIVVTEHNTVVAFNAVTGKRKWRTNLGTPVNGGDLPCGNIDPSGITSTPVADAGRGLVYVVAFIAPTHHVLAAISLTTGRVKFRRHVDPPGANPSVEQQRGALALSGDHVLVPYGGLYGDCGKYHGYVVGVPAASRRGALQVFEVAAARGGAVWAPPGPSMTSDGSILVSTGNGFGDGPGGQNLSNAVIRLTPPALRVADYFIPSNRRELDAGDVDLGSVSPVPLGNGLVFQSGKEGVGYLLRSDHFGHIGGQVFQARVCQGGAFAGTAVSGSRVLVACSEGIVALDITGSRFSVAWRSPQFSTGAPIITGSTVWALALDDGLLRAFDVRNGRAQGAWPVGALTHFATPSASDGRVYVAADRRLLAFTSS